MKHLKSSLLYKNNLIDNIYDACTCCYNNTKPISYLEKKEYIAKRVKAGHESVLEHGRLAIEFRSEFNIDNLVAALTTIEATKDLKFYYEYQENDYTLYVIGNIRFFKYFLENVLESDYEDNVLVRDIIQILRENTPKELYGDIDKPFVNINKFVDIETGIDDPEEKHEGLNYDFVVNKQINKVAVTSKGTKSVTVGYDIYKYNELAKTIIPDEVLEEIIPVTVVFRNASRTCTHQIVRHRNAITQESQRYVDYSDASFTIPVENYDPEKKYNVSIFGQTVAVNLTSLANWLMDIYPQLVNQGFKREEARAFLPSNVNCRRLYMTFTLKQLHHFIKLREDSHAQFEIREYTKAIKDCLCDKQ